MVRLLPGGISARHMIRSIVKFCADSSTHFCALSHHKSGGRSESIRLAVLRHKDGFHSEATPPHPYLVPILPYVADTIAKLKRTGLAQIEYYQAEKKS